MPEKRQPRPIVKQETNVWMHVNKNPRGPITPRETCEDRLRRLVHEQHVNHNNFKFRLLSAFEIYTEPLEEYWKEFSLRLIPNRAQVLSEIGRSTLHLYHDHIVNVLSHGDIEAKIRPLGDDLPTLFYRTNAATTWRVYRFYHQQDEGNVGEGKDGTNEENVGVRCHKDQHRLVEALSDVVLADAYKTFLDCLAQVKMKAIKAEAEQAGENNTTKAIFQLVVPYSRHKPKVKPHNAFEEMKSTRSLGRTDERDKVYVEKLKKEEAKHPGAIKISTRPHSAEQLQFERNALLLEGRPVSIAVNQQGDDEEIMDEEIMDSSVWRPKRASFRDEPDLLVYATTVL